MKILPLAVLCFGLAVAVPIAPTAAQDATTPAMRPVLEPTVKDTFDGLIGAITDDNYAGFLLFVDEKFRAALTKPVFESVVQQVGPRFKAGFKTTYLDQLQRQDYVVHVWKIEFETDDDVLAQVSIKDGKVAGFLLS